MTLNDFLKLATEFPDALNAEILLKVSTFLSYTPRFKNDIILVQPSDWPANLAPAYLPESIAILLSNLCDIAQETVELLWSFLKETVWSYSERAGEIDERFKLHGKDLGYTVIYPPHHYCTNHECDRQKKGLKLNKAEQTRAVLYTLDKGARPAWIVKYYCDVCGTSYHCNYRVQGGHRHYYDGDFPDVIEVGDHQFVETRVVIMWCTDINSAGKSFTNCAHTYEIALSSLGCIPNDWPFKAALKGDHVYNAFTILSLLDDHHERKATLMVPHTGDQSKRFVTAIRERNARIKLYAQPEIRHRCKRCTRYYQEMGGEEKMIWVAVMDGITLGHLTCAVHNCQIPMTVSRDRFCVNHRYLSGVCSIKGCNEKVVEGKLTCQDSMHQKVEQVHTLRGQSRFQLQEKLKRACIARPNNAVAEDIDVSGLIDEDEEQVFDLNDNAIVHGLEDGISDLRGTSPLPNTAPKKRILAQFGRKRTHNEQILVAPCGIILARETFYGAEAIATCAEFIKRTFRIKGMMPNHIFFDNNCSLSKHVKNDPVFKDVGLTADVLHFNCKHSVRDEYCQSNCNPAQFKELHGEDGKAWYFNSSIAEQTNVWLGGFHAIVREMQVDRYNFFLDQMILIRNRMTHAKLEKEGQYPITLEMMY